MSWTAGAIRRTPAARSVTDTTASRRHCPGPSSGRSGLPPEPERHDVVPARSTPPAARDVRRRDRRGATRRLHSGTSAQASEGPSRGHRCGQGIRGDGPRRREELGRPAVRGRRDEVRLRRAVRTGRDRRGRPSGTGCGGRSGGAPDPRAGCRPDGGRPRAVPDLGRRLRLAAAPASRSRAG